MLDIKQITGSNIISKPENDNKIEDAAQYTEWLRCAVSPAYFIDQHTWMIDDVRGLQRFRLFDFQKCLLREFQHNRLNIVLKPRRMGLSWLVSGFSVWLANFFTYKNIMEISIKDNVAKKLLDKSRTIYKHLPMFLKSGVTNGKEIKGEIGTTTAMVFGTGSRIESIPTSKDAGRSEGLALLIIDEAAIVRWMDEILASALSTLLLGGMAIMLSTAYGIGNEFHNVWTKAVNGENSWNPLLLNYTDFPGRDEKWLEEQIRDIGRLRVAQEILCSFLHSGNPVFEIPEIRALDEMAMQPIRTKYNDELRIFREPEKNSDYVIGADTATGEAESWQAAVVVERDSGQQIAEYRSKRPIHTYAAILAEMGNLYNNAIIGVEKNNMGRAVLVHLSQKYPNSLIYCQPKPPKDPYFIPGISTNEFGWETTPRTKPLIIQNLAEAILKGYSGIVGKRTISELYTYVQDGTSTGALKGYSDDLVMAYAIAMEVIRTTMWVSRDLPI
ncbi:MAG: hypothetical protein KA807_17910 [Prolixibacteraceae bacterium]|nr:hypothetical protein [Prolixibacteraceae bacterium]